MSKKAQTRLLRTGEYSPKVHTDPCATQFCMQCIWVHDGTED